jgi:hypothetical protein
MANGGIENPNPCPQCGTPQGNAHPAGCPNGASQ